MSKKVHVTMSPEDYAALQAWKQSHERNRNRPELYGTAAESKRQHEKKQKHQKQQTQGSGLDGFTVFLLVLLAALGAWGWLS